MSRLISDILGAPEPHFSHTVRHWEDATGNNGHDNRLISDINIAQKNAMPLLGLDQHDTTPRELFYALRQRAVSTNLQLESELEITNLDGPEEILKKNS